MNRQQRRKAYKEKPAYLRETKAEMEKRLLKNGITPKDLEANYNKGWEDGFKKAAEPVIQGCYAAICLALNDVCGYGQKRCAKVLNAVDQHLLYSLTSAEAIEEVYKRIGLRIEFSEAFDRVQEVEK